MITKTAAILLCTITGLALGLTAEWLFISPKSCPGSGCYDLGSLAVAITLSPFLNTLLGGACCEDSFVTALQVYNILFPLTYPFFVFQVWKGPRLFTYALLILNVAIWNYGLMHRFWAGMSV